MGAGQKVNSLFQSHSPMKTEILLVKSGYAAESSERVLANKLWLVC